MKFKILAKEHISKFVIAKNGNILVANKSTVSGNFILSLLNNKTNTRKDVDFEERLKSFVRIEVANKYINNYRFKGFSAEATKLFHRKYSTEFEEAFLNHCECYRELNLPIKEAINSFIIKHKLEDSVTYEALKRKYYRYRQKQLKNAKASWIPIRLFSIWRSQV